MTSRCGQNQQCSFSAMAHWVRKMRLDYNEMKEKTGTEYLEFDCVIKKMKDRVYCDREGVVRDRRKRNRKMKCILKEKSTYAFCMSDAKQVRAAKKNLKRAMR